MNNKKDIYSSIGIFNADHILQEALKNNYAIAHINANNLEWIRAIIEVAIETNSPIIIGFSLGALKYIGGFDIAVDIVKDLALELNYDKKVPIIIHLDHGDYESCLKAIKSGFTSIMFDGSKLNFEENFKLCKQLSLLCKESNISFEAELGTIGAEKSLGELADINESIMFGKLGLSCLALGIGNIHGIYPKDWKGLNFNLLKNIHNNIPNIPLVLHGGTGIVDEQIIESIKLGISKININTECQIAFQKALRNYFEESKDLDYDNKGYDPRKILKVGSDAIKETIVQKLKLFGSLGVN